MTRSFIVPATVAATLVAGGWAEAQPRNVKAAQTRTSESGDVTFTVVSSPGQVYLVAEAPAVKFEKVSTETGFVVRVEVQGDSVDFRSDSAGDIELTRKGKAKRLKTRELKRDHIESLQGLLVGSRAMEAFDALAAVLEDSNRPETISVLATHALINALRGNGAPVRAFARKLTSRSDKSFRQAARMPRGDGQLAGASSCWNVYERDVYGYALELDGCYRDHPWNIVIQMACNAMWLIKIELAWSWVIACSGGFPVQ